jgi:hypothetical protein
MPSQYDCDMSGIGVITGLCWTIDALAIQSMEVKVLSPCFLISLPNLGPCPFQLVLYAAGHSSKCGGAGFHGSRGRGRVELRCLAQLPRGSGNVSFGLVVGAGQYEQPRRTPVLHDFSKRTCCGLRKWDFAAAADPSSRTVTINVQVVPLPAVAARGGA